MERLTGIGEGFGQAGAGPAGEHQPEPLQCRLELLASPSVPEGDALDRGRRIISALVKKAVG